MECGRSQERRWRVKKAGLEPVGDGLEGFGGEGFFDGGVFGG